MNLRDFVDLAAENLWRVKLRAFLTTSGVVIAIATFIALMSFGAGSQQYVERAYSELGLFTSMRVFPERERDDATTTPRRLDKDAIAELGDIPGVRLAYPWMTYDVTAALADTQVSTSARALSLEAMQTPIFQRLLGDVSFSSDTASEAILTHDFLEGLPDVPPESLLNRQIVISTTAFSLDSAVANVVGPEGNLRDRFSHVRFDSLMNPDYRSRVLRKEMNEGLQRFVTGLLEHKVTISDTLTIVAVGEHDPEYDLRVAPIVIPEGTARRLSAGGMAAGMSPTDLMSAMQSGSFLKPASMADSRSYSRVTLELTPTASHRAVSDSVEALGFRAFSFAESFEEMQRFFTFFYIGLGIVGVIALITAALGIINTLVMSIIERRREIGIIKSLGADESEIRWLFLAESAVIGAVGSTVGIVIGYLATRVISAIARMVMRQNEMPVFEPFALPFWLILLAFAFGLLVSLLAGTYPASRAARVDPVEALRAE